MRGEVMIGKQWHGGMIALVIGGWLAASGCRDQPAPLAFAYDMAADDAVSGSLLPSVPALSYAYDEQIIAGNQSATIVRRDEFDADAPPPAPSVPSGAPGAQGNNALVNALGGALGKLAGSLPGFGGPGAGQPGAGSTAPASPAPGASGQAGLPPQQATEVNAVVADISQAMADRDFARLTSLVVSQQLETAEAYFDRMDELQASLTSVLDKFRGQAASEVTKAETRLAQHFAAVQVSGLAADQGGVAGTLSYADGTSKPVRFEQAGNNWQVVLPGVPDASRWATLETTFDDVIEKLDDASIALDTGGTVDAARVAAAIQQAVDLLLDAQ